MERDGGVEGEREVDRDGGDRGREIVGDWDGEGR